MSVFWVSLAMKLGITATKLFVAWKARRMEETITTLQITVAGGPRIPASVITFPHTPLFDLSLHPLRFFA